MDRWRRMLASDNQQLLKSGEPETDITKKAEGDHV